MIRILFYIVIAILILAIALRVAIPFISAEPGNLGVTNGQLAPCPNKPNCVSSYATDDGHAIASIPFTGSPADAKVALLEALEQLPRITISSTDPLYVHAVTRSAIMGYIDDNEFLIDEQASVIQVRAAARLGESDMGANRARIEKIRQLMAAE